MTKAITLPGASLVGLGGENELAVGFEFFFEFNDVASKRSASDRVPAFRENIRRCHQLATGTKEPRACGQ